MSKAVVVDHHHDADANVYRLTFALEDEEPLTVTTINPDYDPEQEESEDNPVVIEQADVRKVRHSLEEIVWDADDERWKGMGDEQIASEQRKIVSDMLTKRASDAEQAEAQLVAARKDLGGAGEEL